MILVLLMLPLNKQYRGGEMERERDRKREIERERGDIEQNTSVSTE